MTVSKNNIGRDVGNGTSESARIWSGGFSQKIALIPCPWLSYFCGWAALGVVGGATRTALVPEDQGRPRALASAQMEPSLTNLVNRG